MATIDNATLKPVGEAVEFVKNSLEKGVVIYGKKVTRCSLNATDSSRRQHRLRRQC